MILESSILRSAQSHLSRRHLQDYEFCKHTELEADALRSPALREAFWLFLTLQQYYLQEYEGFSAHSETAPEECSLWERQLYLHLYRWVIAFRAFQKAARKPESAHTIEIKRLATQEMQDQERVLQKLANQV